MVTQTLINPVTIFNRTVSPTAGLAEQPIHAEPHDYGFDHNEAELAAQLRAPLPKDMVQHELADVSNTDVENSDLYLF